MTEFMIAGRSTGKTTEILRWMREAPESEVRVYVAGAGVQRAMDVLRVARAEQDADPDLPRLESWQFLGWGEAVTYPPKTFLPYARGRVVLAVDDLDLVLSSLLPAPVFFVTATGEVYP